MSPATRIDSFRFRREAESIRPELEVAMSHRKPIRSNIRFFSGSFRSHGCETRVLPGLLRNVRGEAEAKKRKCDDEVAGARY